ncbi:hypothetical protein G9F71_026925 [Clostridium sp. FP2]|uniref:hypothetical protein n=1 Tax=Clostridium sp. FP2 TaxID=2724481 RepID=UPI0013E96D5E|nr:hypothetical protein [Clostridium sp. FP2]MBZ9626439.1 hypothetical protein [Clostridium sp. FP2]
MTFTLAHPAVILSLKNKKPNMFNLQRIFAESPLSLGVEWIALLKYTIRHDYFSAI